MKIGDKVTLHPSVSHPMYHYVITSLKSKIEGYVEGIKMEGDKIVGNKTNISLKSIV